MLDPCSSQERPLTVTLAAPKGCGKTAYVAALRHLTTRAALSIDGLSYRVRGLDSVDPNEVIRRQGAEHLELVYRRMTQGHESEPNENWYTYRTVVERLSNGHSNQREVFVLDSKGGKLFPGVEQEDLGRSDRDADRGTVRRRLEDLGLIDAEHALMIFVNEPLPFEGEVPWRMHCETPAALSDYLGGVQFARVIFYVACADVLFPRQADLRATLRRCNSGVDTPAALRRYLDYFDGSPHVEFAISFLRHLVDASLVGLDDAEEETTLAVFWGSSLGIKRLSGRSNVALGSGPPRLDDLGDWVPVQILEPLLWSAGLLAAHEVMS